MTRKLFTSVAGVAISLWAVSAQAQTPVAPAPNPVQAAAQAAEAAATPLPGICVYAQDAAIESSLVGKSVGQRMQQLSAQSNAELNDIMTKIRADDQALTAQRATMTPDAFGQAASQLQQRADQFQTLAQIHEQELQVTQQGALQQISVTLDPILLDAFKAHNCSILIEHGTVMLVQPTMDITKDVVARLDSRIQQIPSFDRVIIPQDPASRGGQAAPAAAGPVGPRTGATAPARAPAAPAAKAPAAPAAGRGVRK